MLFVWFSHHLPNLQNLKVKPYVISKIKEKGDIKLCIVKV